MTKKTYRLKPFDIGNDIWILQERFLLVFWRSIGVGSNGKLSQAMADLLK